MAISFKRSSVFCSRELSFLLASAVTFRTLPSMAALIVWGFRVGSKSMMEAVVSTCPSDFCQIVVP
jgi:hypothetical protein